MKLLLFILTLFVVTSASATYRPPACQVQEPTPTIEQPTPTIVVTVTPEPTPTSKPTQNAPNLPNSPSIDLLSTDHIGGGDNQASTTGAPSSACVMEVDDIDVLDVQQGVPNDNCLDVMWSLSSNGDKVNILYGEYGREFEHALRDYPNAGGSAQICGLKNGVNYKLKIQAVKDRCASEWGEVKDPRP